MRKLTPLLGLALVAVSTAGVFGASAAGPSSGDFAGLVEINGGRKLYLEYRGTANQPSFSKPDCATAPTFGSSSPTRAKRSFRRSPPSPGSVPMAGPHHARLRPAQPQRSRANARAAEDAVADLHALLQAAAMPAPYDLVGHSTGGLIIRLYASTYPKEVVSLDVCSWPLDDNVRGHRSL